MKIGIVQCTSKKKDGEHVAKELYMESPLFRAQRRYVETHTDDWMILSAKYGLISPDRRIRSYDRHISEGYPSLHAELLQEKVDHFFDPDSFIPGEPNYDSNNVEYVIIAGEKYFDRLKWYLDHYDLQYTRPFEGMKLKARERAMIEAAREKENQNLASYA